MKVATALGISVALGALLVLATLPVAHPAVGLERPALEKVSVSSCPVGEAPFLPGYDPLTREMYVPNAASGNITVLKGTCTVAGTVKLPKGAEPVQAVYDPTDNYMFVTDGALNQVYAISGTKVVQTFNISTGGYGPEFDGPWGIAYVPVNGTYGEGSLYVTDSDFGWVTEFTPQWPTLWGYTVVGSDPEGIVYDAGFNLVYVANSGSNTVSEIWPGTLVHAYKTYPVGKDPTDVAFDPANGYVYVTNTDSDNISVFDGSFGVVATLKGLNTPIGVAWDQSTLTVFVANFGTDTMFEYNWTKKIKTVSLPSSASPFGVAYDEGNGDVYVTQGLGDTVYIFS